MNPHRPVVLIFDAPLLTTELEPISTSADAHFVLTLAHLASQLPVVAQLLTERIKRLPVASMLALQALLADLYRGVRLGSESSRLRWVNEHERELIVDVMITVLSGSFEDVSSQDKSAHDLATEIAASPRQRRLAVLTRWMRFCQSSGLDARDFSYICL